MIVASLARHPVKSVAGEYLDEVEIDRRGVVADRGWALYTADDSIASGKTTRRFRRVGGLLQWASVLMPGATVPELVTPDGRHLAADSPAAQAELRAAFGVELTPRPEAAVPHFDDSPVHVVTTSSLAALAEKVGGEVASRRTRANIVVDTGEAPEWPEDSWLGRDITVGGAVLRVTAPMPRCVMVDLPQRGEAVAAPPILRALGAVHDVTLGVMADVVRPGRVRVGDPVAIDPAP